MNFQYLTFQWRSDSPFYPYISCATDNVIVQFHCQTNRPPLGVHCLTVLDNEMIEWLLNARPDI